VSATTEIDPTAVIAGWTRMWNQEIPAAEVVRADASVHFGRTPPSPRPITANGPAELQAVIDRIGAGVPGVHYETQGEPLLDAARRHITVVWNVRATEIEPRTGIDVLLLDDDGEICEVWSVTGDLLLPRLH
jgi:hypothetical protein